MSEHHSTTQAPRFKENGYLPKLQYFFTPNVPNPKGSMKRPSRLFSDYSDPSWNWFLLSLLCFGCLSKTPTSNRYALVRLYEGQSKGMKTHTHSSIGGVRYSPAHSQSFGSRRSSFNRQPVLITLVPDSRTATRSHSDLPSKRSLSGFHFPAVVGCFSQPSSRIPVTVALCDS